MLTIRQYIRPASLEEAYALAQKRNNVVLGGMGWLSLQKRSVGTAIDLCDLGLDTIQETEDHYRIGAMVTLRDLEQHPGLHALSHGAIAESLKGIVGVQSGPASAFPTSPPSSWPWRPRWSFTRRGP